jgi:hypothetical protein
MHRYKTWNGATPTTAAQVKVAVANGVKTMLQLSTPATRQIQLISWGYSIDAALAGVVELMQTDVAATVTAHVAAGVQPLDPNAPASLLTLGTANTGYTASAEGSTTASRVFDVQEVSSSSPPNLSYSYQWTPAERPIIAISKFVRVRTTFGATTSSMVCWIVWDE